MYNEPNNKKPKAEPHANGKKIDTQIKTDLTPSWYNRLNKNCIQINITIYNVQKKSYKLFKQIIIGRD